MTEQKKRVLVAMSGGVDSSVAAVLLQEAGYECVGATMRLYEQPKESQYENLCGSADDVEDARKVAEGLGMEHYVLDFSSRFQEKVIKNFVDFYEKGWTPNPCVVCNRYLKFGRLVEAAKELGCDYIATGHYARVSLEGDRAILKRGLDERKDQSYVLYSLHQEVLKHVLLPLGEMEKSHVREIAEQHHLLNAKKHDSQDICFVPDGDYVGFLERYTGKTYPEGDLVDSKGRVLGKHHGAIAYTIGQRRGLGIPASQPLYVINKDMEKNQVVVGTKEHLMAQTLFAADWNWIMEPSPSPVSATVRVRYHTKDEPATLVPLQDGTIVICFEAPQRAIAPGQAAVAYQGEKVIGGGTIVYTSSINAQETKIWSIIEEQRKEAL